MPFVELASRPNATKAPLVQRVDLRLRWNGTRIAAQMILSHDVAAPLGLARGGRLRFLWGEGADAGLLMLLPTSHPDAGRRVPPARSARSCSRVNFNRLPDSLAAAAKASLGEARSLRRRCAFRLDATTTPASLLVALPTAEGQRRIEDGALEPRRSRPHAVDRAVETQKAPADV